MDLAGTRVVVTRSPRQAAGLIGLLEDEGAVVLHLPTIDTGPPDSWEPLDTSLAELPAFDVVAFTSPNAVESFVFRAREVGADTTGIRHVAAVGGATAESLAGFGLSAGLIPGTSSSEGLAQALGEGKGRSVLVPRATDAPDVMRRILEGASWRVVEVPAYTTIVGSPSPEVLTEVREGRFDVLTFTSGSTVEGFVTLVGPDPKGAVVACLGPQTASAAEAAGFRVDVTAAEQSAAGLVRALAAWDD